MRKRELLFGLGAGVMVAAAVLGLVKTSETAPAAAELSPEEIRAAAEKMEMVVMSKQEYEQMTQEQTVDKLLQKQPASPQKPAEPTVKSTETPRTATPQKPEVSAPASANSAAAPQTPPVATPSAAQAAPSAAQQPATAQAQTPAAQQPSAEETAAQPTAIRKKIAIPYKSTAEGVARRLVAEGILPENNKLVEVLRAQNKLNRIRVGTYEFTVPTSEEEIVRIITTPPQS